jgi:hypothetical protein
LSSGEAVRHGPDEVDDDTLDEGCYYLSRLGLTLVDIAQRFELDQADVSKRIIRFGSRLANGQIVEDSSSLDFWKSVREEAEGNVKVTFVSGKGFHHSWRSDLRKLDGPTLLSIYESCKDFLNLDPSARFLQYDAPKNYDPLAMQREIAKAVVVLGNLLEEKWQAEGKASSDDGTRKR